MALSQKEADYLLALEKKCVTDTPIVIGHFAFKIIRELISADGRERFHLDLRHDSIRLRKYTYQHRARVIVPLVRLDVGNTLEHTNPDGERVSGPHLHLYREGYDDKFAFPLSDYPFSDPYDMIKTLTEFALYCRIVNLPSVSGRLF